MLFTLLKIPSQLCNVSGMSTASQHSYSSFTGEEELQDSVLQRFLSFLTERWTAQHTCQNSVLSIRASRSHEKPESSRFIGKNDDLVQVFESARLKMSSCTKYLVNKI